MPKCNQKILVFQPYFHATGGGSFVAAHIVEALLDDHAVSVLTWDPIDIHSINRNFGTSLDEAKLKVRLAPYMLRVIIRSPFLSTLRDGIILRLCKKIRHEYDVAISVSKEVDFGEKGIQYIHDPPYWLYGSFGGDLPLARQSLSGQLALRFKSKYRPWMLIAGFSYDRMKSNLTLVNSNWTSSRLKKIYAIDSLTIYPPVVGHFPRVSWQERENGFLCIGRISPLKDLEKVIQIITAVRSSVPDAHLHIVGTTDDRGYHKRLSRLIQLTPWITISENVSRDELVRMISKHRYGIHGMVDESFGLSVAEMVRGGCIVFVPRIGGPSELVGGDDRLLYDTIDEAVSKIVTVMRSPDRQTSLRQTLRLRSKLFTQASFKRKIRKVIHQFSSTQAANAG